MNRNAITLSIMMAMASFYFLKSYVDSLEAEQKSRFGSEVLVLKAVKDIKEQETILEDMVTLVKVPKDFRQPGAISVDRSETNESNEEDEVVSSERQARIVRQVVGTVAVVPIRKDEQITRNKIAEPNIRTGLSPQIAPRKRAVSIPVNDITGVAKLVKPGDRVDVIAVIDFGGDKTNKLAKTFLQDVVVLATGRRITNNVARTIEVDPVAGKEKVRSLAEDFSFTSVTLEVTPIEAQRLALLMAGGDSALSLALRNNDDGESGVVGETSVAISDLVGENDLSKIKRGPAGGAPQPQKR